MSVIVELSSNFDDKPADLIHLCRTLAPVVHEGAKRGWKVQAKQCQYLGPFAAAVLAALFLRDRQTDKHPRIVLPSKPRELAAFCTFSGMRHLFRDGPAPDPNHPECETVPLTHFRENEWDLRELPLRMIRRHAQPTPAFEEYLGIGVGEVAQNVVDHSKSSVGGVLCARYMSSMNCVRVAIADVGVGIFESLRESGADVAGPIEALQLVVAGGHSARSVNTNQGLGISNLCSAVRECRGTIVIVSNGAVMFESQGHAERFEPLDPPFRGTVVAFELNLDEIG